MVRKKVEGDESQRRAAAHEARKSGEAPSARQVTTGASKQRTHVPHRHSLSHEDRVATVHRGKQHEQSGTPARGTADERPLPTQDQYTEAHEEIVRALAEAEVQHGGEAVYLEEVARRAGRSEKETRALLHDLVTAHRLVTELQGTDAPDLGPRYASKPQR
jgi:hypothetical protein